MKQINFFIYLLSPSNAAGPTWSNEQQDQKIPPVCSSKEYEEAKDDSSSDVASQFSLQDMAHIKAVFTCHMGTKL